MAMVMVVAQENAMIPRDCAVIRNAVSIKVRACSTSAKYGYIVTSF